MAPHLMSRPPLLARVETEAAISHLIERANQIYGVVVELGEHLSALESKIVQPTNVDPTSERLIYSTQEAATLIGVHQKTLQKWLRAGKATSYKVKGSEDKGRWKMLAADVFSLLEEGGGRGTVRTGSGETLNG